MERIMTFEKGVSQEFQNYLILWVNVLKIIVNESNLYQEKLSMELNA